MSDRRRLLLHVPVGIVNALMFGVSEPAATLFAVGFLLYEVAEDLHHRDRCYADLAGWLWGMAGAVMFPWLLAAARLFTC